MKLSWNLPGTLPIFMTTRFSSPTQDELRKNIGRSRRGCWSGETGWARGEGCCFLLGVVGEDFVFLVGDMLGGGFELVILRRFFSNNCWLKLTFEKSVEKNIILQGTPVC